MNFKSDDLSFSLNFDSIINFFFARDTRKRFKYINILNQNTFKLKSFISLTIFILSLLFILSDQGIFKSRFFTFFNFIDIIREQVKIFKIAFFKARSNKRIFERDFFYYNKALNKASHQFKRIFKFLNINYISIYLFDNIVILGNFTPESSSKSINDDDLFNIII